MKWTVLFKITAAKPARTPITTLSTITKVGLFICFIRQISNFEMKSLEIIYVKLTDKLDIIASY